MQKNHSVEYHRLQKHFAKLCKDTELLVKKTPVFMMDSRLRIVVKRGCVPSGLVFGSLGEILSQREFAFFTSASKSSDAVAVFLEDGKNREFALISKIRDGFSRCVVCSYGEEGCARLSDYYEKLCSYKDYLDSFSGVVCSDYPRIPITSMLRMRTSGVYHLMNMSLSESSPDSRRESAVPLITALEKLSEFVVRTSRGFGDVCRIGVDGENAPVMLSVRLMNVIVSCMGFVARDSIDGQLVMNVSEKNDSSVALSLSSQKTKETKSGIYKEHLLGILDGMGISCRYFTNNGACTLELELKRAAERETVLSEPEKIREIADGCVSQEWLEDVIETILDI